MKSEKFRDEIYLQMRRILMNKRITVIDSIMGSGKTNYAVQYINSHKDENILYVTPFLAEIDRVIS